jgi:hypothetical protein
MDFKVRVLDFVSIYAQQRAKGESGENKNEVSL